MRRWGARSMWCDWEDISHRPTMPGLYCCVCSGQFSLSRLSSPSVSCILIMTGGLEGRGSCILATSGDGMRLGRIYYLIIQTIMPWSGRAQHTLLSSLYQTLSILATYHGASRSPNVSGEISSLTAYFLCLLIKVKLSQTILSSALILTFLGRREFPNIMNNSNF